MEEKNHWHVVLIQVGSCDIEILRFRFQFENQDFELEFNISAGKAMKLSIFQAQILKQSGAGPGQGGGQLYDT